MTVALIVCSATAAASADVVTLRSGEKIEGMIVSADDQAVVVRWGAGRNTATRRIRRADVERIAFTPADVGSIRTLARRASAQGDTDEAADLWRLVIAAAPDDAADFVSAARAFRAAGRNDAAVAASKRAAILAPDDPSAILESGEAALARGDLRLAAERALDYLKRPESRPEDGYWLLGRAFERSNRTDDAADAYKRVQETAPAHVGAFERLVDLALARAAAIEAERLAREFIRVASEVRAGHAALGRALYRQQRYQAAVDALKKASSLGGPGWDRVRVFLGVAKARAAGTEPELSAADAAVANELDPDLGRN